jgi:cytochrome c biogenesis protein CcmG/thiol:disulfide interchange protein DsbE
LRNRSLKFVVLIVLVTSFTIYFGLNDKKTPSEERAEIGFKAPEFSLNHLEKNQKYTIQELNKPVIINFWASWCGPCRQEAPELVRLYEEYKGEVEIYAINLTNSDDIPSVKQFVKEFGFEFPVLLDEDGSVSNAYNVIAIPTTYYIDRNGVVVSKTIGFASKTELETNFKRLVRK